MPLPSHIYAFSPRILCEERTSGKLCPSVYLGLSEFYFGPTWLLFNARLKQNVTRFLKKCL